MLKYLVLLIALFTPLTGWAQSSRQSKGDVTAANDYVDIDVSGMAAFGANVSGTFVATLAFQCTLNDQIATPTWISVEASTPGSASVSSTTTTGTWLNGAIAGCRRVRVIATAYTSGTATVELRAAANAAASVGSSAAATEATLVSIDTTMDNIYAAMNPDAVHDNAAIATGPQLMGSGSTTTPTAVTTGDAVRWWMNLNGVGYVRNIDPCSGVAKTFYVVDIADGTNTEIANNVTNEYFYICSVNLVAAGATTVLISEDNTDGCGSPSAGLHGGSTGTTTEGWSFAANGGIALGNGEATVMKTSAISLYLCIDQSASVQLSGTISYVSAP